MSKFLTGTVQYILYFSECHPYIARPNAHIFHYFTFGFVYCCELLDTTALLVLGTQALRYTRNNICKICVYDDTI